jgi:DNA-binding NarL/FixJ family response regulator/tRNA A-37 threonylcarbamoyl transferase component Bud32
MIGRKLNNRYEVIELIGEGATAAVYRGLDTRLQRTVAIKIMFPYVDSTTRRRFQREALAAARLNHTNIMGIYDVDEEDDQPYLIIEFIEGQPLFSFIPSSPDVVVEFGRQICVALHYAHRQGLIHRDIKPANIHITPTGQVKIMDFGLAITGASKRLTATGRIIGTPAYLSPEQAQGLTLTARTDIYSTGVVLYELVTGALPFDADDIGVLLLQQVKQPPKPPSEIVPEIPIELERVILKSLAKQPEARFETAGAMAAALAESVQRSDQTISTQVIAERVDEVRREEAERQAAANNVIRVALADDHRILRASLAVVLSDDEAIEVVGQADDGAQALDLVHDLEPDVLLLDLNMPGTGGLDVLPEIRETLPDMKVLVLTGRDEDSYIMRALRAGAHGYVLKTTDEDALIQAVKDVADGHVVLGRGVAERVVQLMAQEDRAREGLSEIEQIILLGVASGMTNVEIAERLRVDPQLVAEQLIALIEQFGAKSRTELALIALRSGVISLDDLHDF